METQNLLAFLHVAQSGSFSVAAEQLHLTQPAVSKRVATLEEQLSVRLFDRIGRQVLLTEAGRILLPKARHILQTVREARLELGNLSDQVGGELSLGTSHHIGLHRLPPVLKNYVRRYPEVDLKLAFLDSEQAVDQVLSGSVELAVITLPPESLPNIHAVEVWDDPLQFVVSPSHPLAGVRSPDLSSLTQYPAILPEAHTFTARIVTELFAQQGLPLSIKLASNFLETIKMMVSIDLGWSVLPNTLIDGQLKVLPLSGLSLQRSLGFIHHRDRSLSNAAKGFIDLIQSEQ